MPSTVVTDLLPPGDAPPPSLSGDRQDTVLDLPESTPWFHRSPAPKNLQARSLGLLFLASLGLHGLLLVFPLAEKKAPETPPPVEKSTRITQLSGPVPKGAKVTSQVQPVAKPAAPRVVNRIAAVPPLRSTQPPPPAVAPSPATAAATAAPGAMAGNPWEDFPQYPQAQPGCYNLSSCMQTGKPLAEVGAFFSNALPARKYAAKLALDEPNRKVYQVSRDGLSQFLSLLYAPGKGTVYVVSDAPRSLADLAQAIEVPAAVASVLSNLAGQEASPALFAQPQAFFKGSDRRPEVGDIQLVMGEQANTFFDVYFRNNLVNNGFKSSETPQSYGGGLVYKVTKDDLTLYINLVPTVDGTGTLVVVFKQLPR